MLVAQGHMAALSRLAAPTTLLRSRAWMRAYTRPSPFQNAQRDAPREEATDAKTNGSGTGSNANGSGSGSAKRATARPTNEGGSGWGTLFMLLFTGLGSYGIYSYGRVREDDSEAMKAKNFFSRFISRVDTSLKQWNEPVFEQLLPPVPTSGPEVRPFTLVIDLDNFLVYRYFDVQLGKWRTAKRPGVDMFLFYMAHFYEVVLFSSAAQHEGEPIMEALDPMQFISHRIYRFGTQYRDGSYIKDLGRLNRDPRRVLILDVDAAWEAPPENRLAVPAWTGSPEDDSLPKAVDLLEAVAYSGVADVRGLVARMDPTDPFGAFEAGQKTVYDRLRAAQLSSSQSLLGRAFSSLFGMGPAIDPTLAASSLFFPVPGAPNPIKTGDDDQSGVAPPFAARRAAFLALRQAEYEREMVPIREHYERQLAAQKAYLASQKMGMLEMVTKGPAPPPQELLQPPMPASDDAAAAAQ